MAPPLTAPVGPQAAATGYQRELEEVLLALLMSATEPGWEERFSERERAVELALFGRPEARARIEHLIASGKPLVN